MCNQPPVSPFVFVQEVLRRYEARAPIALGLRLTLETTFASTEIDAVFETLRQAQYDKKLHFSTVVDVMGAVVTQAVPSVNAGIKALGAAMPVDRQVFYTKLGHTELPLSAGLVKHSAAKARAVLAAMKGGTCAPILPGYRMKVFDGAHLAATERRLKVLLGCAAGPLPGLGVVILEPEVMLFTAAVLCEDGHAQERALTDALLAEITAGDCGMGDRNFCTKALIFGIQRRNAVFILREHANLPWRAVGVRRACGRTDTGRVYEQDVLLEAEDATTLVVRRLTLVLDTPTRDGDQEIHLLTTVPRAKARAKQIAKADLARWTIETAFAQVASWLNAESSGLGQPRAALFGFCVGLMAFNVLSVLHGALRAVHGEEGVRDEVSGYHLLVQARKDLGGARHAAHGGGLDALSDDERGQAGGPACRPRRPHPTRDHPQGSAWSQEAGAPPDALQAQAPCLHQAPAGPVLWASGMIVSILHTMTGLGLETAPSTGTFSSSA
jgi:hypothetical protein